MKLTDEEKSNLYHLSQSEGYKVFKRILSECLESYAQGVLNSPIRNSVDEKELFYTKARYEGLKTFKFNWDKLVLELTREN